MDGKGPGASSLRAVLQLLRLPAVFSAMADIVLGFLLTHRSLLVDGCPGPFLLLVAASSGLYLAGMAFNDIFDRHRDAELRPERPLPSGRVSLRRAVGLAATLLTVGLLSAAVAGLSSLLVALLLTAAIFVYDGRMKETLCGPLVMGSCRSLNVLLGASAGVAWGALWQPPQVWIAAGLGLYIAGITWFARNEAGHSSRRSLAGAALLLNLGLLALLLFVIRPEFGVTTGENMPAPFARVVFAWGMVAVVVNRAVMGALLRPEPVPIQRAVTTMLRWLIVLDAVLVYAVSGRPDYALLTALLLLPALLLGRWISVT